MAAETISTRLAILLLALVLALSGCAERSFWKSTEATQPGADRAESTPASPAEPSAPVTAAAPTPAPEPAAAVPSGRDFVEAPVLSDVLFRPGFVTVGKADAKALDAVLRWLTENPGAQVRIEGHTDDLGAPGENVAVGQQRAVSAMKYLVARGVEPGRLSVVSYGSERPVCMEKTTACRAKNRRVHFLVKQP